MPTSITAYRIFVASPNGLQDVREGFRDILNEYNESEATHRGALFIPVGWELTLGGIGRPQEIINEEVRKSDLFLLVLWNRWGSPPAVGSPRYSSGTEEELHVALECLNDVNSPMRQIVIFFKAVDAQQLTDPGEQLQKVLEFKKHLEAEKRHLFHTFDVLSGFRSLLRRHLGQWLREHETNFVQSSAILSEAPSAGTHLLNEDAEEMPISNTELIGQAKQLEREGKFTEAEAAYARGIVRGDDPNAFIKYGRFLRRDGRLAQAQAMFERSLELGSKLNDQLTIAKASGELGLVHLDQGKLSLAQRWTEGALNIFKSCGNEVGISVASGNLGIIFSQQGESEAARDMFTNALLQSRKLHRRLGMARAYGNLGNLRMKEGDFDGAHTLYAKALRMSLRLNDFDLMAIGQFNLGLLSRKRGDLKDAEVRFRNAITAFERTGRRRRLPRAYRLLGDGLQKMGDSTAAEEMLRKALNISTLFDDTSGVARAYLSLGKILMTNDRQEDAAEAFRTAIEYYEKSANSKMAHRSYELLEQTLSNLNRPKPKKTLKQ